MTVKLNVKQAGISLLEVMLSLSIIAIILVMATRYYFVANNNNKINTTVSQVAALTAAAHNWKGVDANYDNISITELYNDGQLTNFPGLSGGDGSATLNDMWGDPFSIQSSGNSAQISVTFPDPTICEALLKAYPNNTAAGVTAGCSGSTFTYVFP